MGTKSSSPRSPPNSCTPKDKSSTLMPPLLPSKTELPLPPKESLMPVLPLRCFNKDLKTEVLSASNPLLFGSNSTKTCPENSPPLESLCIFSKTRELSSPDMDFDCDFRIIGHSDVIYILIIFIIHNQTI